MAAATTQKKKCEFWDKCYRKNKKHKKEFLHPDELKSDDAAATSTAAGAAIGGGNANAPKPRLVHAISEADNDSKPFWMMTRKRSLQTSSDDTNKAAGTAGTSKASNSKAPEPKKIKLDDSNEEIITVNYSKTKKNTTNSESGDASSSSVGVSKKKGAAPQTIYYTGKKEKCKYWDKCYQTGDAHKKEFLHPGDNIPQENSKTKGQSTTSLNPLEDGGTVEFVDNNCKLERDGDIYTCTCKGFLIQRAPINERTCKHLKEYLGDDFDKARRAVSAKPKKIGLKAHIQISLLLAHKYGEKSCDPVGWWISEKLDGVRAYWSGHCFYSRLGNAFYAPDWFTKDLPKDITLDGELFGGRGQFQSTVKIVKTAECPGWKDIKYHVFDSPGMGKTPFEDRMNSIKDYFEKHQPEYAVFVEQTKCKSKEHLDQKLEKVLNLGGEGLMIRQPKSVYERTRSTTLLKIKKFYDAEAIVIGHEKGKGSNYNLCGALRCKMECGTEFSVGSGLTNKDRRSPPKIGSIITYKFQELTNSGVPRFPTFLGVCIDKTEPKDAEIRQIVDDDEA